MRPWSSVPPVLPRLPHDGWHDLFLGASGQGLARSADGLSNLERGPMVLPGRRGAEPYSRHVALERVGDELRVYYTGERGIALAELLF